MILLPNVLLSTARSTYNAASDGTTSGTPYLSGIIAHIEPQGSNQLLVMPLNDMNLQYRCRVDPGTDIVIGDLVTAITYLDGVTNYPFALPSQFGAWITRFAQESAPILLPSRLLVLEYVITGGPAQ